MSLCPLDDSFLHQTARPMAEAGSGHPDWAETLYFNAHDLEGRFSLVAGLEVLPNAGYARGFLFALLDGEHYACMQAGPLGGWREEIGTGSLSFAVVDPLRAWRLDLRDPANAIHAALDFEARGPAYLYRPIRIEEQGELVMDQSYYTQPGAYGGSVRLAERELTGLIGLRARRWGLLVVPRLPFYHWVSFHLPGRCITAWQFESPEGEVLYCDGAVVADSGAITPITRIEHDWTSRAGARHPETCRLTFATAGGEALRVECTERGSHFLGWGPERWSESDEATRALAAASAMSVEECCEIRLGEQRGVGILDVVTRPGYRRYGIAPLC